MKLDATDLRILAELQADGSLSNVELARHGAVLGEDRKSTRLNSSHIEESRMPSSA